MKATNPPRVSLTLAHIWGQRVAHRRRVLGLTQAQLAELAGVTQQTISRIESGQNAPTDTLKLKLARALAEEPARLFAWPPLRELAA